MLSDNTKIILFGIVFVMIFLTYIGMYHVVNRVEYFVSSPQRNKNVLLVT